jgi:hypothetical protein
MESLSDIIKGNSIKLLVAAFVLGGVYSGYQSLERDVEDIRQRQEKKIKVQNELEKRVRNLEQCKNN